MSLKVVCRGDRSRLPLVLLHGWGFNAGVWDGLTPQLEADYCLYHVALPGFGGSNDETRIDTMASLADRLADAVESPAIWLGWSLGGTVAAAVAARHPGKVRGLLTLSTNPCFVHKGDWPGMAPAIFDAFYSGVGSDAAKTLGRFLLLQGQGDDAAKAVVRELKPVLATDATPAALLAGLDRLAEDHRGYFAELAMPRRYLFGEGDALVPAEVAASPLLAERAQLIAAAGHALPVSARDQVLDALDGLQRELQDRLPIKVTAGGDL
ncbi:alpha/beta fold hydrolase [Motiliproteus sediminis]|uniref:alpha/beta fold hydrolase n=1 Tax=Motiliproteus sediminis TaxID=1468178 RepID=UPI001AEF5066|nr:alpha/beta fold hydrolase [Motiliproteus sediminis]